MTKHVLNIRPKHSHAFSITYDLLISDNTWKKNQDFEEYPSTITFLDLYIVKRFIKNIKKLVHHRKFLDNNYQPKSLENHLPHSLNDTSNHCI